MTGAQSTGPETCPAWRMRCKAAIDTSRQPATAVVFPSGRGFHAKGPAGAPKNSFHAGVGDGHDLAQPNGYAKFDHSCKSTRRSHQRGRHDPLVRLEKHREQSGCFPRCPGSSARPVRPEGWGRCLEAWLGRSTGEAERSPESVRSSSGSVNAPAEGHQTRRSPCRPLT